MAEVLPYCLFSHEDSLTLPISLFSTLNLPNFHAGKTKDLGNKLALPAFSSPACVSSSSLSRRRCNLFSFGDRGVYIKSLLWLIFAGNTAPRLQLPLSRSLCLFFSLSFSVRDHTDGSCDKFSARGQTNSNSMHPSVCPGIQM